MITEDSTRSPRVADHWLTTSAKPARPHRTTDRPMGRLQRSAGCCVDGCDRAHRARGLCSTHYMRVHAYGWPDPLTPPPPRPPLPPILCGIADCGGKHFGHGYCQRHFARVYRYGWDSPERKRVQS